MLFTLLFLNPEYKRSNRKLLCDLASDTRSSVITRIPETVLAAVSVSDAIVTDNDDQIEKRKRRENI